MVGPFLFIDFTSVNGWFGWTLDEIFATEGQQTRSFKLI